MGVGPWWLLCASQPWNCGPWRSPGLPVAAPSWGRSSHPTPHITKNPGPGSLAQNPCQGRSYFRITPHDGCQASSGAWRLLIAARARQARSSGTLVACAARRALDGSTAGACLPPLRSTPLRSRPLAPRRVRRADRCDRAGGRNWRRHGGSDGRHPFESARSGETPKRSLSERGTGLAMPRRHGPTGRLPSRPRRRQLRAPPPQRPQKPGPRSGRAPTVPWAELLKPTTSRRPRGHGRRVAALARARSVARGARRVEHLREASRLRRRPGRC
jgi:hypothetical protein